ncbi:hypothetical protein V502_11393 [Pseudogymnoascus sp. VKM F-4520 (FW-2644)]|nr:hypothetical protein V502_11393 [Pseudogymnoascus sp. VKM F-4520 (FW-2644)]
MPQASVVEWIAGGTLPRQRRHISPEVPQSNTAQHRPMGARNNSGCCPTCCSCSGCDVRSETSTDTPSKRVRFKQPKGILKHTRRGDEEENICCSACTPSAHCNERHTVGKNGKVYGSSKKCAPKGGKKEVDHWGESKSTSNSPRGMKDTPDNNYPVSQTQIPPSPPQTPEQRRTLQNLSSFITKNMSRLILPSRAEVIIREDVLENASDPRPNAFFDARTGMLRVYHGPMYGNPGGSLVPLQAQHVPIGTPAPPTSAWANPWAGMMGGMGGRWPFSVNSEGAEATRECKTVALQEISTIRVATSLIAKGTTLENGNSGWNTADNNANDNSNDDAWGTGNDDANNDSPGQVDTWGTDNNNNNNNNNNSSGNDSWGSNQNKNNASSGDDNWGTSNNNNASSGDDNWGTNNNNASSGENNRGTNNNNASSGDDNWGTGPDNSNSNNNDSSSNSRWSGYKNRPNQNGTSQRIFPDATGIEFSAGSWGEPSKQESWGDKSAAQSTKNNSNDTSGW